MNYLIKLKDGEEEYISNSFMVNTGSMITFILESGTIHFPLVNVLFIKEFESTNFKVTTTYI